jgi:hypothetical protein
LKTVVAGVWAEPAEPDKGAIEVALATGLLEERAIDNSGLFQF